MAAGRRARRIRSAAPSSDGPTAWTICIYFAAICFILYESSHDEGTPDKRALFLKKKNKMHGSGRGSAYVARIDSYLFLNPGLHINHL